MKDYDEFPVLSRIEIDVVDWRGKGHRIAVDVTTHLRAFYEPLPMAARIEFFAGKQHDFFGCEGAVYAPMRRLAHPGNRLPEDGLNLSEDITQKIGRTTPLPPKHTMTGEQVRETIQASGWSIGAFGKKYRLDAAKVRIADLQGRLREDLVISDGMVLRRTALPEYYASAGQGQVWLQPGKDLHVEPAGPGLARICNAGLDRFQINGLDAANRYCLALFGKRASPVGAVVYFDPAHVPDARRQLCLDIHTWHKWNIDPSNPYRHWAEIADAAKAVVDGADPVEALSRIAGIIDDAIFEGALKCDGLAKAFLDRIVEAEGIAPYRPALPGSRP